MQTSPHVSGGAARSYLVGLLLALALTAVPFGLVAARVLPPTSTLAIIAVAAIAQIVVHLRCFLHLGLKPSSPNVLILCFAAVLIFIMIGGSMWIMFDLHYRMMGG
jgi:cytochrome o ubiquinol oxidase operon protein cyoD